MNQKNPGELCVALATLIVGSFGCGAADFEESVSHTQQAINISSWDALVSMPSTGSHTLTANIDATGRTWTPKAFSGTFDGGNRTISNLTINGGSFFSSLSNATIKNVKFTNLKITGGSTGGIGGLATSATNTTIQNCAVEASINVSANAVGGLIGTMTGGSIFRSYAKGTIGGSLFQAGGLVGVANRGSVGATRIHESYAQVTISPDTSGGWNVIAGGVVGYGHAPFINDVYAVGNVTGRGRVGGIIGELHCVTDEFFELQRTIYRGDVVDRAWTSNGGWAGGVGTFGNCSSRFEHNFYDRTLDPSTQRAVHPSIRGYTTNELRSPTSVTGGVFCLAGDVPGHCGDDTWSSPPWTAGTSSEHHVLMNMPGPNTQPR